MSLGTVTIQVSPQTAEVLRQLETQAKAREVPLDIYLHTLAEENNNGVQQRVELTPEEKVRLLNEWVNRNAVHVSHFVDDSRESIYAEREDQQL